MKDDLRMFGEISRACSLSGIVLQISNMIYHLVFRTSEIDERDVIATKQFWNKYLLTTDRSRIPWEVAREMR